MKKLFLVTLLAIVSLLTYSQDKIYTHRGDSIICKVTEMGEKSIKYKYIGEDLINSITKILFLKSNLVMGEFKKLQKKL